MLQQTISQLLTFSQKTLEEAGVEDPLTDSWLLLSSVLHLSRTQLYLAANDFVSEQDVLQFSDLLQRRVQREPVAYILSNKEFWSLPFFVNEDVLIPRPETEFMLEKVFSLIDKASIRQCLDLCCGSGAIACVLAKELAKETLAVDISLAALAVTLKNVEYLKVGDKVTTLQSDLFDSIDAGTQFSLIVSNPPYIRTEDVHYNLAPEVRSYEPHLALDGGVDGMDIIMRIADEVPGYLETGGHFFMEMGSEQGSMCHEYFEKAGRYKTVEVFKDYSGRDRVLHCTV